ncbi:MAG: hypothetical protein U5N85_09935 [Arcicella sp.]|nr:hypothetical protein [Arcicella sp.]
MAKIAIPQEKPVVTPPVEQKPVVNNPKNVAALEALETELASYKGKRTIFKVLSIASLGTTAAIFIISNGKYSDYTAKVDKNNAAYTTWYKGVYGGDKNPDNSELAQPISSGEYTSPSILPMAGAAVVGIGLFLWGGKYGKLARETQRKN